VPSGQRTHGTTEEMNREMLLARLNVWNRQQPGQWQYWSDEV